VYDTVIPERSFTNVLYPINTLVKDRSGITVSYTDAIQLLLVLRIS